MNTLQDHETTVKNPAILESLKNFGVTTGGFDELRKLLPEETKLGWDGDMYCALLGADLQEGTAEFAAIPAEALALLYITLRLDGVLLPITKN